VHIEPLNVADACRGLYLLLALHEDGLDVAALYPDGDGDLIEANTGVAGGVLREEGHNTVAVGDALPDRAPPVLPALDRLSVEPNVMATILQVGFDARDKLFVAVMTIAQENAQRSGGMTGIRSLRVFGYHRLTISLRKRRTTVGSAAQYIKPVGK
jgi:hypothetical protein